MDWIGIVGDHIHDPTLCSSSSHGNMCVQPNMYDLVCSHECSQRICVCGIWTLSWI